MKREKREIVPLWWGAAIRRSKADKEARSDAPESQRLSLSPGDAGMVFSGLG